MGWIYNTESALVFWGREACRAVVLRAVWRRARRETIFTSLCVYDSAPTRTTHGSDYLTMTKHSSLASELA